TRCQGPCHEGSWHLFCSLAPSSLCRSHICLEIRDRCVAVHAVIEVDDVAPAAAGRYAGARGGDDLLGGAATQGLFVDVSLEDELRIVTTGGGQVVAYAQADDVGTGGGHPRQIKTFLDKENSWHTRGCGQN